MKIGDSSRSKVRCAMPSLGVLQSIRHEKTDAKLNVVTSDRRRVPKRLQNGNGTTDTSTAWLNRDVSCRRILKAEKCDAEEEGDDEVCAAVSLTIQQIEFELEKAERGMAMPYDAERVMQLRHTLREVRKQKLSVGLRLRRKRGQQ